MKKDRAWQIAAVVGGLALWAGIHYMGEHDIGGDIFKTRAQRQHAKLEKSLANIHQHELDIARAADDMEWSRRVETCMRNASDPTAAQLQACYDKTRSAWATRAIKCSEQLGHPASVDELKKCYDETHE